MNTLACIKLYFPSGPAEGHPAGLWGDVEGAEEERVEVEGHAVRARRRVAAQVRRPGGDALVASARGASRRDGPRRGTGSFMFALLPLLTKIGMSVCSAYVLRSTCMSIVDSVSISLSVRSTFHLCPYFYLFISDAS